MGKLTICCTSNWTWNAYSSPTFVSRYENCFYDQPIVQYE